MSANKDLLIGFKRVWTSAVIIKANFGILFFVLGNRDPFLKQNLKQEVGYV